MSHYRSDFSLWNLDWLELRGKTNVNGQVISIPNNSYRSVKQISILDRGDILLLIPDKRVIQIIESGSNRITTAYEWNEDEDLIDMTVAENKIYVIDAACKRISLLEKEKQNTNRFKTSVFWSIQEYELSNNSHIVVSHGNNNKNKAYVFPTNHNKILSLDIDSVSSKCTMSIQDLKLKFDKKDSNLKQKIGSEINVCLDDVNWSLIITDTQNHRIFEVDCKTGVAEIICGTGHLEKSNNVVSKDGLSPHRIALSYPRAVAIYRPSELISSEYLSRTSRKILESDETRVRPRTLIISDSGNNRVLKLIELPKTHLLSASSKQRKVFTLLGEGKYPIEMFNSSKENLKSYKIDEPVGLIVSARGELLVWKKNIPILTLLRPVTAVADLKIYTGSLTNSLQDSD